MRTSDLVKSMIGFLSPSKSDPSTALRTGFEAIEPFRQDRFFKQTRGLSKIPGSVWMRQRLDSKASLIRDTARELAVRLLVRAQAPITAYRGTVCCDIDTFAMEGSRWSDRLRLDNGGSLKEAISRTYQGFDGYTPIAAYLGNEGWSIGLELRPGSQHSALETEYVYERVFPRLERLVPADQPELLREDSGFDSARLLWAKAALLQ